MEAKWKIGRLVVRKTHSALLLKLVKSLEAKTSIPNILGSIPNILGVVLYGGREDVNDYPRALLYCFFFFLRTLLYSYDAISVYIYENIYIFYYMHLHSSSSFSFTKDIAYSGGGKFNTQSLPFISFKAIYFF